MTSRVAIVGVGQTRHEGAKDGQSYYEVVFEAANLALQDAALDRAEVDTVIASGWDVSDGRTISDMYLVPAAGGYLKDCAKAAEDGILAFAYAWLRIASGAFDTALVVAHGHAEAPAELPSHVVFDPFLLRPLGLSGLATLALQAQAYLHRFGLSEEQAAGVVVRSRAQAARNPYAHLQSPVTVQDVLASRPMASPLKELDLPPRSVGAVGVVLASEEKVKRISGRPAWVRGIGWAADTYEMGAAELWRLPALTAAAERACGMAGLARPPEGIDVGELYDSTSFHQLMNLEALGWAHPGQGRRFAESARRPVVNPSGGVLSTHLHSGSGLLRVAEAALQVTGRAGEHQVGSARTALAHGVSAPAGAGASTHCVVVLGGA